ncbi:biotin-dependent carboxyltransferase family protein [Kutzneria sp. 744]|uniref:5-oxoprolinase subunit C family protein n=1 Tax=Kutzneria sp. (strain 744) TaxID=345341 RepID=UPI0004B1446E|nr:biotin-dependent carboxyltransferase family protein [Kutzneria sp. 744]
MSRSLTVVRVGPQTLIQDLGRPGNAHLGVPPSGALDVPALTLANRLVGNPESAAGIEALLGRIQLRANCSCTVAVTGPSVLVSVGDHLVDSHAPVHLRAGDVLGLGAPVGGLRCYVAVSGGIDVPLQLSSRATDILSGIGPDPLRANDVLPLGSVDGLPEGADVLSPSVAPAELVVPVLLGPREDWFDDPHGQLAAGRWTVSQQSNRVGLRLDGTALRRAAAFEARELPSEGVVTGSVQVPANGRPVLFLADHPVTGGYPVIGVVTAEALPRLAQARPGTPVRLQPLR